MKIVCPNCEDITKGKIEHIKESYPVKGEPIEVDAEVLICQQCNEIIFDESLDSGNLETAYNSYRQIHCILSPLEIAAIRNKYQLSQRSFSRLLGWSEVSMFRYESGSLPDAAHNQILMLLEDPTNMKKVFDERCNVLPANTKKEVDKTLHQLLFEDSEPKFKHALEQLFSNDINILSGYKRFDLEKLKNMILFFTSNISGAFETKLNKLLWYADFLHFKEYNISISGSRYIHHKFGPVPEKYELITAEMTDLEDSLESLEITFPSGMQGKIFRALNETDISIYSKNELKVLEYVAREFKDITASEIKDISHAEAGYIKTEFKQPISYEFSKELSLSLSQNNK